MEIFHSVFLLFLFPTLYIPTCQQVTRDEKRHYTFFPFVPKLNFQCIHYFYSIGYANVLNKKEHAPKRKRSRSRSGGLEKDDLNYVDEDSDLSSGDDGLVNSDTENNPLVHDSHHPRKRGRPKVHNHQPREERKVAPPPPVVYTQTGTYTPPPMPSGYVSDYDESGEAKVDKFGRLQGGKAEVSKCVAIGN